METEETIKEIVEGLSVVYHAEKQAQKKKEEFRKSFFEAVTASFGDDDLAEDLVTVDAESGEEAIRLAAAKYPKYNIVDTRKHPDLEGKYEVIIEENPEFKSFAVEVGGEVWQRQSVVGSPTVDDEALQAEDPDLFEAVTFVPEPERQMRSLAELDDATLAKLERYIRRGKITLKLPAPKAVKA